MVFGANMRAMLNSCGFKRIILCLSLKYAIAQYTNGVICTAGTTINPSCSAESSSECTGVTAFSYTCFSNSTACPLCPPGTYQPQASVGLRLCPRCTCGSGSSCCLETNPVSFYAVLLTMCSFTTFFNSQLKPCLFDACDRA